MPRKQATTNKDQLILDLQYTTAPGTEGSSAGGSRLLLLYLTMASRDAERQPLVPVDSSSSPNADDIARVSLPGEPLRSSVCSIRVRMGLLMCSAWVVAYSDRTNISLAIIAMEDELGFDTVRF